MATTTFHRTIRKIHTGGLSVPSGVLKMALLKPAGSWTPNRFADEFVDAGGGTGPIADEITVGQVANYSRQAIAGVNVDESGDTVTITGSDVTFGYLVAGATGARALLFLDLGGADTANPILAVFDGPPLATDGRRRIVWASPGIGWFRSVWRTRGVPRALTFDDMTYLGNFGVNPTGTGKSFGNVGRGVAVTPDGSQILLTSASNFDPVQCLFDIPETLSTEVATDVYRSSYGGPRAAYSGTQFRADQIAGGSYVRVPLGYFSEIGTQNDELHAKFQGLKYYGGELFVTYQPYYQNGAPNWTGITYRGAPGQTGWAEVGNDDKTKTRGMQVPGYIVEIPDWFSVAHCGGWKLAGGYMTAQGDARTSQGIPLFAYDETLVGLGSFANYADAFIDTLPLLFYPRMTNDLTNRATPYILGVSERGMKSPWHNYYPSDEFHGGAWVDGALTTGELVSGFVAAGVQGIGKQWNIIGGLDSPYYDNRGPWWEGGQGHHNSKGYENALYTFSPLDMIRALNGDIETWQIQPNDARIGPADSKFWIPSFHSGQSLGLYGYVWDYAGYSRGEAIGCDWHAATRRLYVGQWMAYGGDGNGSPLIHVWELN